MGNINIVIGSWGSYNACNEKALGSEWLDLSDYDYWEEIQEELEKQGFDLNGIDEELFIQDIEGIDCSSSNWDYIHPQTLFETLKESGVLEDNHKYDIMQAFIECRSYNEFEDLFNLRDKSESYKNIFGESFTASAYGIYYAYECLKKGINPKGKNVKNVLIYNHYENKDHSLILLTC